MQNNLQSNTTHNQVAVVAPTLNYQQINVLGHDVGADLRNMAEEVVVSERSAITAQAQSAVDSVTTQATQHVNDVTALSVRMQLSLIHI